jgi:hypothetical protein
MLPRPDSWHVDLVADLLLARLDDAASEPREMAEIVLGIGGRLAAGERSATRSVIEVDGLDALLSSADERTRTLAGVLADVLKPEPRVGPVEVQAKIDELIALRRADGTDADARRARERRRDELIRELEAQGTSAATAIPELRRHLSSGDYWLRSRTASALARAATPAHDASGPALAEALAATIHPAVRRRVMLALGRLGPNAVDAVPDLMRALDVPDVGADLSPDITAAIAMLGANNYIDPRLDKRSAALALAGIGPMAKKADIVLKPLVDTPDWRLRYLVRLARRRIHR